MRVLSLIASLLFVVSTQAAPRAVTTNTSSTSLAPNANPIWKHISASAYISNASSLTAGSLKIANGPFSVSGSADLSTDSAFGINGRYSDMIQDRLSYFGGLSMDTRREISSVKSTIPNSSGSFGEKPAFRPFIAEGGLRYDLSNMIYATAGLNYTIYNMVDGGFMNGAEMTPAIGYQAAIGGSPFDRLALELSYREVRFNSLSGKIKNSETRVEISDLALTGINLGARYSF